MTVNDGKNIPAAVGNADEIDMTINSAISAMGEIEPDVLPHRLRQRLRQQLTGASDTDLDAVLAIALKRIDENR